MARANLNDLAAFTAVARARSFTKAAAQLGVSQSALSHAMRTLEERLGLRLLARTTRSVAPTPAGERLLEAITPHLEGIEAELAALDGLRDQPAGTIRLTAGEHATLAILYPAITRLTRLHPDIKIEVNVDNTFADIVANRFDAGVRLGERVEKDMIAVRIGPDMRMAIVGTPSYFERYPKPATPGDLTAHNCVNMRLPTFGNLLAWEFEKDGQEISVKVDGQLIFNTLPPALHSVLNGLGLGYCPEDFIASELADGSLIRVMEDWCQPFPGYHLYYPSRRQPSPAFTVLVDLLRYRAR